jgi:hypothetical protein
MRPRLEPESEQMVYADICCATYEICDAVERPYSLWPDDVRQFRDSRLWRYGEGSGDEKDAKEERIADCLGRYGTWLPEWPEEELDGKSPPIAGASPSCLSFASPERLDSSEEEEVSGVESSEEDEPSVTP